MLRVKVFSFLKYVDYMTQDWLKYHVDKFGADNIVVIEHDPSQYTSDIIKSYIPDKNLLRYNGAFSEKSRVLSDVMTSFKDNHDLLLPLDSDEFIVVKNNFDLSFSCNFEDIDQEISIIPSNAVVKFGQYLSITEKLCHERPVLEINEFFYSSPQDIGSNAKTAYCSSIFLSTDQGNHGGTYSSIPVLYNSNLSLVHMENCGYERVLNKSIAGMLAYGHASGCNPERKGLHWKENVEKALEGSLKYHINDAVETMRLSSSYIKCNSLKDNMTRI